MIEKELEILKQIEELYHGDISEQEILDFASKNQTKVNAWKEAFSEYPLYEVSKAISYFYTHKSSKTRPNIAQISAILEATNAEKEVKIETDHTTYLPDYDYRYMHQDVESGNCHHNLYYYTEALKRIRKNEYPFIADIQNPTSSEMTEVLEDICEKKIGKKWEFLSKNDLISQGYDMNKTYSVAELTKTLFKRMD